MSKRLIDQINAQLDRAHALLLPLFTASAGNPSAAESFAAELIARMRRVTSPLEAAERDPEGALRAFLCAVLDELIALQLALHKSREQPAPRRYSAGVH